MSNRIDRLSQLSPAAVEAAAEIATAWPAAEAARLLRRCTNSIYSAAARGRLRIIKIGGKIYLPNSEIERILLAAEAK